MTDEKAAAINKVKYSMLHFAWDNANDTITPDISVKLKRPRILTIYKHKGKYTPAEVIRP